jgi:hypothetical protein
MGELRVMFGDVGRGMLSYCLRAFFPGSLVQRTLRWVSYALCLVALVADVELCIRAFSVGHLCSGR